MYKTYLKTPIGELEIEGTENTITGVTFVSSPKYKDFGLKKSKASPRLPQVVKQCVKELQEYFAGKRKVFTVPVAETGTQLQMAVWKALKKIKQGGLSTYKNIAKEIKNPKAVRAVGTAIGNNRLIVIVPCHRVVASDGGMGGYGGGLERKEWLLKHEGVLQ